MNRQATWLAIWCIGACVLLAGAALHVYFTRYPLAPMFGAHRAVLVVTRDLAAGEPLSRAALDFRELPESYLEERHIVADDLERVLGSRVTGSLGSGAALLWSDLDVVPEVRTLSGLVATGMRAFSLLEHDAGLDGLLRPGDRVDVLFTRSREGGAAALVGTSTLLENVMVLSVGADLGAELPELAAGSAQKPANECTSRITLSVTLEQAQLLAQSEGRGAFRLALRNPQDLVLAAAQPGQP